MRIKILSTAVADLDTGRKFYEAQGREIGEYFFDSLFSDIDSLALYGGIHSLHFGYHRLLSKRFPYAVYYTKVDDLIVVWRILDLRRNPYKVGKELKKKANEEKEILKAFESGKMKLRKPTKAMLAKLTTASENTFKKDKRINIRFSSHDLIGIQRKASQKGLPYQALISGLIHQYVEGDLLEKTN